MKTKTCYETHTSCNGSSCNVEAERNHRQLVKEITALLKELKGQIGDDYRANEEDDCPGMQVTVATNDMQSWTYQTGDNSYSGGCYGCKHWGVISLYRRSNSKELAEDAVDQMAGGLASEEACKNFVPALQPTQPTQ